MPLNGPLTECEQRLPEAAGALVDVRAGEADQDDLASGRDWGAEWSVRVEFLQDLLTDRRGALGVPATDGCCGPCLSPEQEDGALGRS